jgi:hypothetical protein
VNAINMGGTLGTRSSAPFSPADPNRSGTKCDSFEDVGSTSYSSVDHDLKVGYRPHFTLLELGDDFDEDLDTGSSEFLGVQSSSQLGVLCERSVGTTLTSCRPPWLLSTTPCIPALIANKTSCVE